MKYVALLAALLLAAPSAYAADAKPPPAPTAKPVCGKTIEDCQKAFDDLTAKVSGLTVMAQALRKQRDANAQFAADAQVDAFVAANTTASAPVYPAKK